MTGVSSEKAPRKPFSGYVASTMPLAVSRISYLRAVEQPEANVIRLKIGAGR